MSRRRSTYRRHRRSGFIFFHVSFRLLLIICASALIIGYLSAFVNPEIMIVPTLFGLYFIPLAILNLILLIVAVLRRSYSFWIPLIALLPTLYISEFMYQPPREPVPWSEDEVKILTYNVGLFRSGKDRSYAESRDSIMEFITGNAPDVICLQEYSTQDTSSIRQCFPGYSDVVYHLFRHSDGRWTGNVTASRLPIASSGTVEFKGSTNMSLWCDVVYRGRQYRIFNNHLESNAISLTSLIKKVGRRDMDVLKPELEKIHERLKSSVSVRSHQTTEILANINSCRNPSIVCGDFNDIPLSYTFHSLYKGRKDSFVEAGSGFGSTYSVLWPMLRIDYVLLPEQMTVLGHTTPEITYSDHYPVITRLKTSDENKQ